MTIDRGWQTAQPLSSHERLSDQTDLRTPGKMNEEIIRPFSPLSVHE